MDGSEITTLLLNTAGLTPKQLEDTGRARYEQLFIANKHFGIHELHDKTKVIFHKNRFDHAFFSSTDIHSKDKNCIDENRIKRINWIQPLMSGKFEKSACWDVPGLKNASRARLYVMYGFSYVLWLEERDGDHGIARWKFSSAYDCIPKHIRNYTKGGNCVAKFE